MKIKLLKALLATLAMTSLAPVQAQTPLNRSQVFACGFANFLRLNGTELRTATFTFRNLDLVNPMTINRITVRNLFGTVIHDSGPAVGVAHPYNTDLITPLDITTVPPGASYYLSATHLFGNDGLPVNLGGRDGGQAMYATIEVLKAGKKDLVSISTRNRARERLVSPTGAVTIGAERSSDTSTCETIN